MDAVETSKTRLDNDLMAEKKARQDEVSLLKRKGVLCSSQRMNADTFQSKSSVFRCSHGSSVARTAASVSPCRMYDMLASEYIVVEHSTRQMVMRASVMLLLKRLC